VIQLLEHAPPNLVGWVRPDPIGSHRRLENGTCGLSGIVLAVVA